MKQEQKEQKWKGKRKRDGSGLVGLRVHWRRVCNSLLASHPGSPCKVRVHKVLAPLHSGTGCRHKVYPGTQSLLSIPHFCLFIPILLLPFSIGQLS